MKGEQMIRDGGAEQKGHKVFLCIPVGGDRAILTDTMTAVLNGISTRNHSVVYGARGSSALTANFNALWAQAYRLYRDGKADVFVMLHTDVAPQSPHWLDEMMDIFDRTQADALSVALPIKSPEGLTSTAIDTNQWVPRRLSMRELYALPATFGDDDVSRFGGPLLLNTGLLAVRLGEWMKEVCWRITNDFVELPDGNIREVFEPEDWNMSRQLHKLGKRLFVTREIAAAHSGSTPYPNDHAWGSAACDPNYTDTVTTTEAA